MFMKKKLIFVLAMLVLLVCVLAISVSAARVENYNDTFTLQSSGQIIHYEKWLYNEGKSMVRKSYTDAITISFFDKEGNPLTEVAMWEYDEEEGKYYSLVWYISDYELFWEDQIYSDANVGEQTYPKYTRANYTLKSVRALDLRYLTYNDKRSNSTIESWKEGRTLKALKGIYLDVNNTPNDTKDDLKLQDSVGIGRDYDNYGYYGYEAQFEATGNKIVVGNFRDCDFQCDREGNYGTSNTWSRADNLQCLWYPDTMLYIYAGVGSVYEVDLGDNMEIIACQILRDNKRVKELRIPNSVLYINNEAFRGSDLTTLIVGEGLMVHGGSPFLYTGGADNVYFSKNIISSAFTSMIERLVANNSANIYFDGDATQAQALMDKLITENSNTYKGKITLVDYKEQSQRGDLKNVVIFYNYNTCDAFYMGQHQWTGERIIADDYFKEIIFGNSCTLCKSDIIDTSKTIAPLFIWKGYTVSTYGDTYSMAQGFFVNNEAVEAYKKYVPDFEFGLIATGNKGGVAIAPELNGDACISQNKIAHDYFDIKISGITDEYADSNIIFCVYVKAQNKVLYLDNNSTSEKVTGITYNNASKL